MKSNEQRQPFQEPADAGYRCGELMLLKDTAVCGNSLFVDEIRGAPLHEIHQLAAVNKLNFRYRDGYFCDQRQFHDTDKSNDRLH